MTLPKRVALSKRNILKASFTLPSGKVIKLSSANPTYETSDPDELEFFANQKGIAIVDLDDKAFASYVRKHFTELPRVQNREITFEDIEGFEFTTDQEDKLVQRLKDNGWTCYKRKT